VREAPSSCARANVGSVVLVACDALTGIVTDATWRFQRAGRDARGRPRGGHASAPVVTAAGRVDGRQAAELMISHGIGGCRCSTASD